MKYKLVLFILFGILMSTVSCRQPVPGQGRIEKCKYTQKENVSVANIRLKAPTGMSSFFYGSVPSDRIFRTLTHALVQGNFWANKNNGHIRGNLKSSGHTCTGDWQFNYKAGSSRIGGNFLNLNTPKGVNFLGTVTMLIRSDDYKNSSNPNIAEYVLWSGSGNDPQFEGINGNLLGARKTYNPSSGKVQIAVVDKEGCYIRNGSRVCR
jgi:hypothetical protein